MNTMAQRAIELACSVCQNSDPNVDAIAVARDLLQRVAIDGGVDGRGRAILRAELATIDWQDVEQAVRERLGHARAPKRQFFITVSYFKPSGKFYIDEKLWMAATDSNSKPNEQGVLAPPSCYMPDIVDRIRAMNAAGELPGLSPGSWEGSILVTCEDHGYPVLIPPLPSPAVRVDDGSDR